MCSYVCIHLSLRPSQFFRIFMCLWQFNMANCSVSIPLGSSAVPQPQLWKGNMISFPQSTQSFSCQLPIQSLKLKTVFLLDLCLQRSSLWLSRCVWEARVQLLRDWLLSGLLLFPSSRLCCCTNTVQQPPLSAGFLPHAPLIAVPDGCQICALSKVLSSRTLRSWALTPTSSSLAYSTALDFPRIPLYEPFSALQVFSVSVIVLTFHCFNRTSLSPCGPNSSQRTATPSPPGAVVSSSQVCTGCCSGSRCRSLLGVLARALCIPNTHAYLSLPCFAASWWDWLV